MPIVDKHVEQIECSYIPDDNITWYEHSEKLSISTKSEHMHTL